MSQLRDIDDYLRMAVENGASDLHLSVDAPPAARINGAMIPLEDFVLTPEATRTLVFSTLSETQRSKLETEWELDYAIEISGLGRFRANVHYARNHIEAAFRHIPPEVPDLSQLGHSPTIERFCQERRGLILVTGVTGSGKTTTLAAMVKRIAETRSGVIITIEDPVEFLLPHRSCLIKQREIGKDTKSFTMALRQALRQDPDVIVVSELRDLETIRIALTAAETGHLVLATLHTIDAPQTIDRLVDVFPPDQQQQILAQLSNVLEGIICQRLLPKADGTGRVLASEVMCVNYGLRSCIRDRKIEQLVGLMEIGSKEGMHTIDDSLDLLLRQGTITREEALFQCRDKQRFLPPAPARTK
ncbi:MAG: type IV pili twitching motility protein PilT [Verrucomicrobiales bacterium VVV1]|nr:MAG: type IV pili twitching motility protein PilT [Verrucomicrobiales bacterium VVV1]